MSFWIVSKLLTLSCCLVSPLQLRVTMMEVIILIGASLTHICAEYPVIKLGSTDSQLFDIQSCCCLPDSKLLSREN